MAGTSTTRLGATVCALPKVRLGNGSAVSIATCAAGRTVCAAENRAGALRAAICGGCLAAWLAEKLGPSWTPRITKQLKCLTESGKIPARGTTPRRVLENSLVYGLDSEFEVSGPLRTTRSLRLGQA